MYVYVIIHVYAQGNVCLCVYPRTQFISVCEYIHMYACVCVCVCVYMHKAQIQGGHAKYAYMELPVYACMHTADVTIASFGAFFTITDSL